MTRAHDAPGSVVVLSGGVGGARFLRGVARALPAAALTAIVNTGDDFEHWGLRICPDLDTVLYTLAGLADETRGWGRVGETFHALAEMKRLGGPDWFSLGDRDLATHLLRTQLLASGVTLTAATARLFAANAVSVRVLPMSDVPRPTLVDTVDHGTLSFQDWFVRLRCAPRVRAIRFGGEPRPAPGVLDALERASLVLVGPSNPYVSIEPILALDGVRAAVARKTVVAVSPIVGGAAVKGPLAEMIRDLAGEPASAAAVARHYGSLLAGLVVERGDEAEVHGTRTLATGTWMKTPDDAARLAREALAFAAELAR